MLEVILKKEKRNVQCMPSYAINCKVHRSHDNLKYLRKPSEKG